MLEGPLPSYRTCRLYFLHQLLTLSCPCPPFSSPVFDSGDCSALLSLLDGEYFPFLSLSQWAVRRTSRLHLHHTTHSAQQPSLIAQELQPLDTAIAAEERAEEVKEGEEEEGVEDEEVREEEEEVSGVAVPPPSSSPAVREAVAQLRVQFQEKLNAIERGRVAVQ
jgi:hypothetical protein